METDIWLKLEPDFIIELKWDALTLGKKKKKETAKECRNGDTVKYIYK